MNQTIPAYDATFYRLEIARDTQALKTETDPKLRAFLRRKIETATLYLRDLEGLG